MTTDFRCQPPEETSQGTDLCTGDNGGIAPPRSPGNASRVDEGMSTVTEEGRGLNCEGTRKEVTEWSQA